MKKRIIKWENIIYLLVLVTSVILYTVAINKINFDLNKIKSYRLFWILTFVFITINLGNALLWEELRKERKNK